MGGPGAHAQWGEPGASSKQSNGDEVGWGSSAHSGGEQVIGPQKQSIQP